MTIFAAGRFLRRLFSLFELVSLMGTAAAAAAAVGSGGPTALLLPLYIVT